ncbi:MAG: hypothetical protein IT381_08170 [Deltaproteobacteria bacterium]|nr:hypothetical protein [Deltaproteobacteria bacterium]
MRVLKAAPAAVPSPVAPPVATPVAEPKWVPRMELEWGYNRGYFTNSTIAISGPGYAFTIHDVSASDRPEIGKALDLINTIAQFNARLSFRVTKNLSIGFGTDHMKYVLDQGQTTTLSGTIMEQASAEHAGNYDRAPTKIGDGIVNGFEHTNGLNLVDVDVGYVHELAATRRREVSLSTKLSGHVGVVVPKSDITLFGQRLDAPFHIAGYGLSASAAVRVTFVDWVFVEAKMKGGFIHLPDVTAVGGKASHMFGYFEPMATIGVSIPLGKP